MWVLYFLKITSPVLSSWRWRIMSDEANFHLSGYVSKQNGRYWSDKQPHSVFEKPPPTHSLVWSVGFWNQWASLFWRWQMYSDPNINTILNNSRGSLDRVGAIFSGRVVSCFGAIIWPAKSPDLSTPHCFLLGHFKTKLSRTNFAHLRSWKSASGKKLDLMIKLCRKWSWFIYDHDYRECIARKRDHFSVAIFKK